MADDITRASEELAASLEKLFEARQPEADSMRNLQSLARVAIEADVQRFEQRYGADHPKTVAMKSRLSSNTVVLKVLEEESEILGVRREPETEGELVIDGRIIDHVGRGLEGALIGLLGTKHELIGEVKPVKPQRGGYFAIRISKDLLETLAKKYSQGVHLGVLSEAGAVLQAEETALALSEGDVPFQEIILLRTSGPVDGGRTRPTPTKPEKPIPQEDRTKTKPAGPGFADLGRPTEEKPSPDAGSEKEEQASKPAKPKKRKRQ